MKKFPGSSPHTPIFTRFAHTFQSPPNMNFVPTGLVCSCPEKRIKVIGFEAKITGGGGVLD